MIERILGWVQRMGRVAVVIASVSTFTATPADGGDVPACAGPQGQLRLAGPSGDCRPSETPIQLATGGGGIGALHIVDSQGQFVGFPTLLGPQAARNVGGIWFILPVGPAGFDFSPASVPPAARLFESDNCSGEPFLSVLPGFLTGLALFDGTPVYPGPPIQIRTIRSSFSLGFCFGAPFFPPRDILTGAVTGFDTAAVAGLIPPFELRQ